MLVTLYMKFGTKEHLEKMQKEGILYCNTITYFSRIDDNNKRGDKLEVATELEYLENVILEVKPANDSLAPWEKLRITYMQLQKHYEKTLGNLYCMSVFDLTPSKDTSLLNFENFTAFGSHVLIISREDIFIDKINKAFDKLKIKSCFKAIEYLDLRKYQGKKSLFQKDIKYSWQKEFRIILYTDKCEINDPFEFSIGNIEDISIICDISKTKKLFYKIPE